MDYIPALQRRTPHRESLDPVCILPSIALEMEIFLQLLMSISRELPYLNGYHTLLKFQCLVL
jgi:hypothetical protein